MPFLKRYFPHPESDLSSQANLVRLAYPTFDPGLQAPLGPVIVGMFPEVPYSSLPPFDVLKDQVAQIEHDISSLSTPTDEDKLKLNTIIHRLHYLSHVFTDEAEYQLDYAVEPSLTLEYKNLPKQRYDRAKYFAQQTVLVAEKALQLYSKSDYADHPTRLYTEFGPSGGHVKDHLEHHLRLARLLLKKF